jgi:hypothetical protein
VENRKAERWQQLGMFFRMAKNFFGKIAQRRRAA